MVEHSGTRHPWLAAPPTTLIRVKAVTPVRAEHGNRWQALVFGRGVYTMALKSLAMLVTLVFVSVMGFLVTPGAYGALAGLIATVTVLSAIGSFGQQDFAMRSVSKAREEGGDFAGRLAAGNATVWVIQVASTVGAGLGLALLWQGQSPVFALSAAILVVAGSLSMAWSGAVRALGGYLWSFGPRDIFWRLGIVVTVGVLGLGWGVTLGAAALAAIAALVLVVCVAVQGAVLRPRLRGAASLRGAGMAALRSSVNLMVSKASVQLTANFDVIVVAGVVSTLAAAEYYPANRLALVAALPAVALQMVIAPHLARLFQTGDAVGARRLASLATVFTLVSTAGILLCFAVAWPLLEVLFPTATAATATALKVLLASQIVQVALGYGATALAMAGCDTILRRITLYSTGAGAVLILGAAHTGDLVAIAGVTAVVLVARQVALAWAAYRILGIAPMCLGPRARGGMPRPHV